MDETFAPAVSAESGQWLRQLMPEFTAAGAVRSMLDGGFGVDPTSVVGRLIDLFAGELRLSLRVLALLLALGIFSSVLGGLRSSFGRDGVARAAELASAAYLTAIALETFSSAVDCAVTAAADLGVVMDAVVPLTLSLMLSGGMPVSGSALHPIIYFMCSLMSRLVRGAVIPLSLAALALYILGSVTSGVNTAGLADLCQRVNRYLLSFIMVIFTGVLSVTKFAAASFDSVAARGLKFAVSSAVPLVGGSIADAMSAVAGGSLLLKNTVGALGVAFIIGVALLPVVKIGALSLVFRIGGALMGPLGAEGPAQTVAHMAACLEMLVAAVAATAIMMVIGVIAVMT